MVKKHKNILMNCLLSIAIFVMLFVSLFFYRAYMDNYIFYTFTDFNFNSILDYCLHYGNGRLLGNIICAVSSHLFNYTPLLVSISLLGITLLLNKLIFNSNYKTLLLVFIPIFIIEFLSVEDIYTVSPMYINYVLPFLFFLVSLCFYSVCEHQKRFIQVISAVLMCVFAVASSLFSENTTVLFVLFSLLLVVSDYIKNKKIALRSAFIALSFLAGMIVILLLPHIFGVADLLDWYRGSLDFNVKNIIIQTAHLSYCIAEFSPILLTISLSIVIYLFFLADKKVVPVIYLVLLSVPAVIIILINKSSLNYILTRLVIFAFLCIFAAAVLITLFIYIKKEHRMFFWGLLFIVLSGIGMCLFIEPIGVRLIFAPYFFSLICLFLVLKEAYPAIKKTINISTKLITSTLLIMVILLSAFSFLENVDDFNNLIYSVADESIRQTVDLEDSGVNVGKFIFAFKNRWLAHPQNSEDIFKNETSFLEHIDSFDH